MRTHLMTSFTMALFTAGIMHAQAAEAPYYNPGNAASPSKRTTGYELYKTIGCPGKELLGTACKDPATANAAPAPVLAPAPAPAKSTAPDSDKDGVIDAMDQCPNTPPGRTVDARGCELDGDRDGVVDALDRCPNTPPGRMVNAQGCELDGDGDGIVDALDRCPNTPPGDKVDAKGCTLANTIILEGVNFDIDSANLRPDSYPILDEAVATLKRYPGLKVEVAGHTDSTNSNDYNMKLSDQRSRTVIEYFVRKGIDASNLTMQGYGEEAPIADNKTAAGRAQNRRVELRIQP